MEHSLQQTSFVQLPYYDDVCFQCDVLEFQSICLGSNIHHKNKNRMDSRDPNKIPNKIDIPQGNEEQRVIDKSGFSMIAWPPSNPSEPLGSSALCHPFGLENMLIADVKHLHSVRYDRLVPRWGQLWVQYDLHMTVKCASRVSNSILQD